jgi:arginine exporter protein ArgO
LAYILLEDGKLGETRMILFLKAALKTLKVFIIFTGCTILFYYGIMLVNEEYQNYHRYDEPEGAALKVSNAVNEGNSSLLDRLMLFYLNGE